MVQAPKAIAPAPAGVQRQCECGQHTLSGECNECKQKKMLLQRSANGRLNPPVVPPVVQAVAKRGSFVAMGLGAAANEIEQPDHNHKFLERSWLTAAAGPRPQFDFSQVPVYTDSKAEKLAHAANMLVSANELRPNAASNLRMVGPSTVAIPSATDERQPGSELAGSDPHEVEADVTADGAVSRLEGSPTYARRAVQTPAAGVSGLGAGHPMSAGIRRRFERAFGWDFSGVRLHTGTAAAALAARLGARAFALGRNLVFGSKVADPEASVHRRLLAHELTHVIQQDMGAGAASSLAFPSLSAVSPSRVQAAPLVTNVVTSAAELGVGGNDITATATVAGAGTAVTWSINPGGAAPAGVTVVGGGRRVRIHAAQPGGVAVVGGAPITIRAAVTATPGDFSDSPPVALVQVVSATYAANPALANVPSLIPGVPPPNSAEPNRDGIAGNTATVNAVTAPAGRPITVTFRRPLGATIAGNVVTPGATTGDIGLRIADNATQARLDETKPTAIAGAPAALMADLTVNAVPTRVLSLANAGALGPYGQLNRINFAASDAVHPPLTRIIGELITAVRDDFNTAPPNVGFNPAFVLAQAVPANTWQDQVVTPAGILNVADGLPAIDVNRFVGPGVPQLPRQMIDRQRFQYASWQGAGAVLSNQFSDGQHVVSLTGSPGAFRFRTDHHLDGAAAPQANEAYVGNPLIVLSNVTATPTAAGATGLAADGAATANLAVNSTVAGRTVNWTVLDGDITITAGNPAVLPATATLTAGVRAGTFHLRAADTIFPNRRVDGPVRVVPVQLHNIVAAPPRVAAGVLTSNVSINAEPGGRILNWIVDAAAAGAGVTVAPAVTGPGNAMNVTVTRPAAFKGNVTVTAADSVVAAKTARTTINFL